MHIMFVDDNPYNKVEHLIRYLKDQNVDFSHVIINCSDFAIQYLAEHNDGIDLAIVDLGLPKTDDCKEYSATRGLDIIDEICNKYPKIPVIINSEAYLPNAVLQHYADTGLIFKHCKPLLSQKLIQFTKKGNIHLIEPNIGYSGVFVFWVDSDDSVLVKNYANQLKKSIEALKNDFSELTYEITVSSNKIKLVTKEPFLESLIRHTGDDGIQLFTGEPI